ncbi:MAG: Gfo/Idh/MocA family oxidoreductase [Methanoregula sp.]|nr:Gfo/Idh/MocA family oxidoreductase [Methanoregula sp.]
MVYRVAVIGCGKIGSEFAEDPKIKDIYTHAGAYTACKDTEIVAVCDAFREKAEKCARFWKIPCFFTDYEKLLLEKEPEIISICTPDPTHYPIIKKVLESEATRAVLAEKPLALTVREAQELVRIAKGRGIILAVNYSRRHSEMHRKMRSLIDTGTIGSIQAVSGYYTKGTMHSGTHWFDLARFLIGEIDSVRGDDVLREGGPDPTYDVKIEFFSGIRGYLHGCDNNVFSIFEMDIIGTKGRIWIHESGHRAERFAVEDSPFYSGYHHLGLKESFSNGMHDTMLHAVEDLVGCLKNGSSPACSGSDGVEALRIAKAVGTSVKRGRSIPVDTGV